MDFGLIETSRAMLLIPLFLSREPIFISLRIQALAGGDKPRRYFSLRTQYAEFQMPISDPLTFLSSHLLIYSLLTFPTSQLLFRIPHSLAQTECAMLLISRHHFSKL
jgi:hypothetical protein